MSALGQKQTFRPFIAMSALHPKADIGGSIDLPRRRELKSLAESMALGAVADPQAAPSQAHGMAILGRPFGRLFPLFGCFCHAFEKYRRAFYRRRLAGTINFPPPRLLRIPPPLHDERIVSWVKLSTHALLDGNPRLKFQTRDVLGG